MKTRILYCFLLLFSLLMIAVCQASPKGRVIEITAKRFSYEPSEITLKKGEPVILRVRSKDVTHGFSIEEFHIKGDVHKNQNADFAITPNQTGDFVAKCSHFCGSGHGSMKLIVHVEN